MKKFDLVVIGSGPGGYVAAIRAGQLGMKTALIDRGALGGTCLNYGCIPTKTLIAHSEVYKTIQNAEMYGIDVKGVSFDFAKMKGRKDEVIKQLQSGIRTLLKASNVTYIEGTGSFVSSKEILVMGDKPERLETEKVLIATGSVPTKISPCPVDGKLIHDSTTILELKKLPKHLIVLGAGYIGCEFASLYSALGVKITMIEALPGILWLQGKTVSAHMTNVFKSKGIDLKTDVLLQNCKTTASGVEAELSDGSKVSGDMLLVSVGRSPYTENLGLDKIGLGLTDRGFIDVDDHMRTPVPNIFAIGDVTGKVMLAHVASEQGIAAVENMAGHDIAMDYSAVPAVVFTDPEIATTGLTLEDAKAKCSTVDKFVFPFAALGKAKAAQHEEGFFEIYADPKSGKIYGATVIGDNASNLISDMTLAVRNELTIGCITETIYAHPTLAEGWMEVANLARGLPIHLPAKPKG